MNSNLCLTVVVVVGVFSSRFKVETQYCRRCLSILEWVYCTVAWRLWNGYWEIGLLWRVDLWSNVLCLNGCYFPKYGLLIASKCPILNPSMDSDRFWAISFIFSRTYLIIVFNWIVFDLSLTVNRYLWKTFILLWLYFLLFFFFCIFLIHARIQSDISATITLFNTTVPNLLSTIYAFGTLIFFFSD